MSDAPAATPPRKGILERLLSPFAAVRAGEGPTVLLLAVSIFVLLLAYYLIKVVREPLIVAGGGAELKSYSAAGQALLLIPVIKVFDWLSARVGRLRLAAAMYLFFASNLVIFYVLAIAHVPIGVPFFLWVGIFNVTAIAQLWGFANDIYTDEQGRRLFAIVGAGASLGAVVGARVAGLIIEAGRDGGPDAAAGLYVLMLVAAGLLVVCLALTWVVDRRESGVARARSDTEPAKEEPIGGPSAFTLVRASRYLALIAGLILLLNLVNSTGEYILDRMISVDAQAAAGEAWLEASAGPDAAALPDEETFRREHERATIGAFRASFFFWVNVVGLLIQLFLVSRVLEHLGVRIALFVLPAVVLLGYAALLVAPVLAVVRVMKVAENSIDYSLQNTTQQALWLVTSREAKYKAKTLIDTFVRRIGDVAAALLVAAGVALAFDTRQFVVVALVLAVVWIGLVAALARAHRATGDDA